MRDTHICTNCGYEGRPIRRPDDSAGEEEDSILISGLNKVFFALTMIPFKFGWIVRVAKRGKAKTCPNCGLPLMVKLSSDAGWMAKRKSDIKSGAYIPGVGERDKPRPVAFGRELKLGDEEEPQEAPPAPKPEKLPSLGEMLEEPRPAPPAPAPQPAPAAEEPENNTPSAPPPKKVDPDAW